MKPRTEGFLLGIVVWFAFRGSLTNVTLVVPVPSR
jgi:hypothetical protein